MASPTFEIHESHEDGWLRLTLLGELDLASAPILKDRLEEARNSQQSVLVDVSRLEFMDSSGLQIMIKSIASASMDGWRFAIDPDLSPQVSKLFHITSLDQFVGSNVTDA